MGLSYLNCVGEERERERERERESILIPWLTEQDNISFINEESFFKLISFFKIASMTCGKKIKNKKNNLWRLRCLLKSGQGTTITESLI